MYPLKDREFLRNYTFLNIEIILLISKIPCFLYKTNTFLILDRFFHYLDQLILDIIECFPVLVYSITQCHYILLNFFSNAFVSSTATPSALKDLVVSTMSGSLAIHFIRSTLSFRSISTVPQSFFNSLLFCSTPLLGNDLPVLWTVNFLFINSVYTSECFNCRGFIALMKTSTHLVQWTWSNVDTHGAICSRTLTNISKSWNRSFQFHHSVWIEEVKGGFFLVGYPTPIISVVCSLKRFTYQDWVWCASYLMGICRISIWRTICYPSLTSRINFIDILLYFRG